MGGSTSKSAAPTFGTPLPKVDFTPDYREGTYSGQYLEQISKQASDFRDTAQQQLSSLASQASSLTDQVASESSRAGWYGFILKLLIWLVILAGAAVGCIAIYDAIACQVSTSAKLILFPMPGKCNNPPPPPPPDAKTQATAPTNRPMLWNYLYGPSSGNLLSQMFDSTSSASISSSVVPLSTDGQGAYGIQWWMFVKDWNYGYGKEKVVLSRSDSTNSAIENPRVSLAPTQNNLQVSVSIFPSSDGGSSKAEPAPANNSGATDDVFTCEVPNIPLQSWFSVSMTVFDRNLDIYINGNLVKSCFLPGVPKPAAGNIDVSKEGGFSGYICDLNHYSKALTPSDAQTFYGKGTSCSSKSGPDGPTSGYSVKFGVYDVKGKEVKEYTF